MSSAEHIQRRWENDSRIAGIAGSSPDNVHCGNIKVSRNDVNKKRAKGVTNEKARNLSFSFGDSSLVCLRLSQGIKSYRRKSNERCILKQQV